MRQNKIINKTLYMNFLNIQSKLYHLILILQINKKEKERKKNLKYYKKIIKGKKKKGTRECACERDVVCGLILVD